MAKPLRPKRGTTAKNDAFTGLASEITIDTDKHSIRVHDGVTAGGHEILPKTKNDELYAPKDLDVGVTSFNGETGAVSYTAPVTSVDGKTGAVDLSGVYQPKGNYLTSAPVTSVMGQTGAITGLVLSVNDVKADPSGNVPLEVGGFSAPTGALVTATVNYPANGTATYTMPCNGIIKSLAIPNGATLSINGVSLVSGGEAATTNFVLPEGQVIVCGNSRYGRSATIEYYPI